MFKFLVLLLLSLGLRLGLIWGLRRFVPLRLPGVVWQGGVGLVFCMGLFLPIEVQYPQWIQLSLVEGNVREILSWSGQSQGDYKSKKLSAELREKYFSRSLKGPSRFTRQHEKPNVLLLVVEGLGIEDLKQPFGKPLLEVSREGLLFTRFIAQQRQTHRGLYALMCGDYPNLGTTESKSDLVGMFGTPHRCLPDILADQGYQTEFMQCADLGFMRKDLFAAATGFQKAYGDQYFKTAGSRHYWGVDDRTLLNGSLQRIEELTDGGKPSKPWMLTLLTAGTHHPFNVPRSAVPHGGEPTREDAIRYVSEGVRIWYETLKSKGVLDDTLVLITSDEVDQWSGQGISGEMIPHWGFLIVLAPEKPKGMIDELFAQSDVLLSVTDYLEIETTSGIGRSFFRKYPSARNLLFANVHSNKLFLIGDSGQDVLCDRGLSDCQIYERLGSEFQNYEPLGSDPTQLNEMRQVVAYNDLTSGDLESSVVFEERGENYLGSKQVLGNHTLSLEAEDTVSWRLVLSAGQNKSFTNILFRATLSSSGTDEEQVIFEENAFLPPGQTLLYQRSFKARKAWPWVSTDLMIGAPKDASVRVEEIRILKNPGWLEPDRREVTGRILSNTLEILNVSSKSPCLIEAQMAHRPVLADECQKDDAISFGPELSLERGRKVSAEYTVEVLSGRVSFAGAFLEGDTFRKRDKPVTITGGQKARVQVNYELVSPSKSIKPALAQLEAEPGTAFRVISASLKID